MNRKNLKKEKKITKYVLITISVFICIFYACDAAVLYCIQLAQAGTGFYFKSVSVKICYQCLKVTLFATVIAVVINTFFGLCAAWVTTKFSFNGKTGACDTY